MLFVGKDGIVGGAKIKTTKEAQELFQLELKSDDTADNSVETEAQGMGEDDENEAENLNSDTSIFAPKKHSSSCSLVKIK